MSITLEFTGDDPAENPFARFSWTRAAVAWMDEAGPLVREALKREAPVAKATPDGRKGGRLRDSIRYERETAAGNVTGIFTANVPYARYVLEGTGPHVITAQAARALRFYPGGEGTPVFRRSVNHPGTKANPFNERALLPLEPLLRRTFADAVRASAEGA